MMSIARDKRYKELHFPGAKTFQPRAGGGFVPLPIVLRKLMRRHLSLAEFRVLMYLMLRASAEGICYPGQEEMQYELSITKKNLDPHLRGLQTKHFISMASTGGKRFYLIHDPRETIGRLATEGSITAKELEEINELLADLKQEPISIDESKVQQLPAA